MVEGGHSPLLSLDELAELGFSIVINPLTGLLAIVPVIRERFAELRREGTVRTSLERLAGFDEMTSIVGLEHP
jgi:2-methylisocitrate lyase-like PEP mutase family enzyme